MGHAPPSTHVRFHGRAPGRVWHLCTRAESARMTVPGSHVLVQAIMSAIDDYAERDAGNREYFWNRPQGAGG
jgi:hypothetical protein